LLRWQLEADDFRSPFLIILCPGSFPSLPCSEPAPRKLLQLSLFRCSSLCYLPATCSRTVPRNTQFNCFCRPEVTCTSPIRNSWPTLPPQTAARRGAPPSPTQTAIRIPFDHHPPIADSTPARATTSPKKAPDLIAFRTEYRPCFPHEESIIPSNSDLQGAESPIPLSLSHLIADPAVASHNLIRDL
jgi:hypothetical protein